MSIKMTIRRIDHKLSFVKECKPLFYYKRKNLMSTLHRHEKIIQSYRPSVFVEIRRETESQEFSHKPFTNNLIAKCVQTLYSSCQNIIRALKDSWVYKDR